MKPATLQKQSLLQKVREILKPKATAATLGVGVTYGILLGALLLLPFPPKSIQAQSTDPEPLPLPEVPIVYEVHVTGAIATDGNINETVRGLFDISIVTDSQQWTYYKYCWSGIYKWEDGKIEYIDATDSHDSYFSYVNY